MELEQNYCKSGEMSSFTKYEQILKITYKLCLKMANEGNLPKKIFFQKLGVKTYVIYPQIGLYAVHQR